MSDENQAAAKAVEASWNELSKSKRKEKSKSWKLP